MKKKTFKQKPFADSASVMSEDMPFVRINKISPPSTALAERLGHNRGLKSYGKKYIQFFCVGIIVGVCATDMVLEKKEEFASWKKALI